MARFIFALLLAATLAPAWAADVDAMSSILLVSKKEMRDPFFADSVVLVTHRAGPAPIGVIINRPTKVPVAKAVPEADKGTSKADSVFFGGPVATEEVIVIFRMKNPPERAIEILEDVYISMDRRVILDIVARNLPAKDVRFYMGYSGWARGQLEHEVSRGDWHLVRADAASIFDRKPDTLWNELERKASAKPASLGSVP